MKFKISAILLQFIADILAIVLSWSVHYWFRFESGWFGVVRPDPITFILAMLFILVYWIGIFWFSGLYKNWYVRSPFDEMFRVFRVVFLGCFILFFFIIYDSSSSPRMLFLAYFLYLSISVVIGRTIVRRIQIKLRAKGIINIPVIVVGTANEVYRITRKMSLAKNWGYRTIGVVLVNEIEKNSWLENEQFAASNVVLGDLAEIESLIRKHHPSELVISMASADHDLLLNLAAICAKRKVAVKIEPDLYDYFTGMARTFHLYGIPLIDISTQLMKPWQETTKRAIDLVFSGLVIIFGLPVWIVLAMVVKFDSPGPIFFKQVRIGRDGEEFEMIKFRSMTQGNAGTKSHLWTKVGDKRVTKFGKFIRKSHLDEIPQFWNVLLGEMSVVGPRPEQPGFVKEFQEAIPYYYRRHLIRPGITGWWQVKYTSYEISIEEIENRLKDDFFYIENMSIKLDIEIILRTVFLVFKGHGQT
jgi:exopolysaccharide biosynthesis polyprenyl glycosylphosphotransferase